MESKAITKGVRISPLKARLVIDTIRGKSVKEARALLKNLNKKASYNALKTLESAVANAVANNNMKEENLYVKEARIDMGQTLKRVMADSRGRAGRNDHRSSHFVIVVAERD